MRRRGAIIIATVAIGCARKAPPVDAEARALADAVDLPSMPSDSAPTVRCPATRIIVSKDAIHVTNVPAFAEIEPKKRDALRAQASEDERYGLPLLARNVMRVGASAAHAPLGPLRSVLEFARAIDVKLLEQDDERLGGVEILADKATPIGLLFDVANTAAIAGMKPSLRVRDGGGASCTTLLLAKRAPSGLRPTSRHPIAAVRIERDGASLRGCRVLSEPMCEPLERMLKTIGGPKDPCTPTSDDDETFTVLQSPDDLSLGDLFGSFRDLPLGLRSFVLAASGSRYLESFRARKCREEAKPIDLGKGTPIP